MTAYPRILFPVDLSEQSRMVAEHVATMNLQPPISPMSNIKQVQTSVLIGHSGRQILGYIKKT
jgi:hypothetical protein